MPAVTRGYWCVCEEADFSGKEYCRPRDLTWYDSYCDTTGPMGDVDCMDGGSCSQKTTCDEDDNCDPATMSCY